MRELDRELEGRINPERTRQFRSEQFEANREYLERTAQGRWQNPGAIRIAVVGSNGKGSLAYYLARLFELHLGAGAGGASRVGLYTSPHLIDVCERIRVDGIPVRADVLLETIRSVAAFEKPSARFSYFEALTLAARAIFSGLQLPVEVYEAGLGGRLDATRVARAEHVLVASIVREHVALLGADPEQILREKLGICTESARTAIILPQPLIGADAIRAAARAICPHVRLVLAPSSLLPDSSVGRSETYLERSLRFAQFCFHEITGEVGPAVTPFPGPAGRLECRRRGAATLCYDTAHNEAALRTTLASLAALPGFPGSGQSEAFFGCLPDRDPGVFRDVLVRFGFAGVTQVVGPELAAPAGPEPGVPASQLAGIVQDSAVPFVLVTGTHRLYGEFTRLFPEMQSFLPAGGGQH